MRSYINEQKFPRDCWSFSWKVEDIFVKVVKHFSTILSSNLKKNKACLHCYIIPLVSYISWKYLFQYEIWNFLIKYFLQILTSITCYCKRKAFIHFLSFFRGLCATIFSKIARFPPVSILSIFFCYDIRSSKITLIQ